MGSIDERSPEGIDAEAGVYRGRRVARRFVSPDGMTVLVGRSATDNDILSLKLSAPADFWLHVAGESGSHVVVKNPQKLERMPRSTLRFAAALAVRYSKAGKGGKVAVHVARCRDVHKPRGSPPGEVALQRRYRTVQVTPIDDRSLEGESE